jgi:serine protease Do
MNYRTLRHLAGLVVVMLLVVWGVRADGLDPKVQEAEAKRIAAVEKAKPSVVALFNPGGQGGGSGVLISDDGYALTNFHVVEGTGPVMKCGLPDGVLYDGVLVGLDKVGDVALIKLLPKKEDDKIIDPKDGKFPFAVLADSDKVKEGDWSFAMGNPFLLATDFTPTVTFGLVSGVHRYQYPAGTLLEYTDCIQVDTSINPGNSGGPLFNMNGELIGINGRGSFEKRGRVNSGVGYAISINQIKNFMGQLRAGLDTDHASVGALIGSEGEDVGEKLIVKAMIDCDARRRGLDTEDELVAFAGRPMGSVNQFKNVLGLFPRGWRVPMTYRRENEKREILVRLMGVQRQEINPENGQPQPGPAPAPRPRPGPGPRPGPQPIPDSPAKKLYEAKPGFANFYFNKLERERLLAGFHKQGDFSKLQGDWKITANGTIKGKRALVELIVKDKGAKDGNSPLVQAIVDGIDFGLEPFNPDTTGNLKDPPDSGGLLAALFQYRQLLAFGEKGFATNYFSHGGTEPFYLPPPEKERPDYSKLRVDCEVLRTQQAGVNTKFYFSPKDQSLLGFEASVDRDEDPCEVYLSEYKDVDGRKLPGRIVVRYGDKPYADLKVDTYKMEPAK